MSCQERERMEREHLEAEAAFYAAQQRLRNRIGISPKEEFVALSDAVDQAWKRWLDARGALDQHIRNHGCGANNATASLAAKER
jgi:hypothetical protein